MPLAQFVQVDVRIALGETFAVTHHRRGHHHHPSAGEMHPPAQVELFAAEGDVVVETSDGAEEIRTHEKTGARHTEHVSHGIVLLLVAFTRHHDGIDLPRAVTGQADVLEQPRIVPVDELRSDDARIRPEHLGDQLAHDIGGQGDVVVEKEEQSVVPFHHPGDLVLGRTESGVADHAADHAAR